jgi:hypothetical protein
MNWEKEIEERRTPGRSLLMAGAAGLADLAARFAGVETMASAEIGANVIGALTSLQEKPEYAAITTQLSTVAMNLKNLK